MKIEIAPNEKLIREGMASLQRGVETVGGRLYLTDSRLVFSSHQFNVQTGCTEIPLAAIRTIRPCWTRFLGILPLAPNSLAVNTGSTEYRFVLPDRASWAQTIQSAISVLNGVN
jgi:hypothetical protein